MKRRAIVMLISLSLVILGLILFSRDSRLSATSEPSNPEYVAGAEPVPVLVELFTSEGCSSCPPADELLSRLEQTQPVPGARIIGLSEHVDYWNRLGWTDPFSSSVFSQRQNDYANLLNNGDSYTPQMIVDGRAQFVGSNSNKANEAIAAAARRPKVPIDLRLKEKTDGQTIPLAIRIDSLSDAVSNGQCEVLLAITESGLRSAVPRGENAGRTLTHSSVVRRLTSLGILPKNRESFTAEPVVSLEKDWRRDRLRAIVFVKEIETRRVVGVAALPMVGTGTIPD